jgi:hypothetical protein
MVIQVDELKSLKTVISCPKVSNMLRPISLSFNKGVQKHLQFLPPNPGFFNDATIFGETTFLLLDSSDQ